MGSIMSYVCQSNAIRKEYEVAVLNGFTEPFILYADHGAIELSVLVQPDADLDGEFTAWDRDCLEFITLNGWLFSFEAL